MPMDYVISSHGAVNFHGTTTVPANVRVLFYQNFGMTIANMRAMAIQSALCTTYTHNQANQAASVLANNPTRAMWQSYGFSTTQNNDISLTPDANNPKAFKSGIVRALDNAVVLDIDNTGAISLTQALAVIANDARSYGTDVAVVHCLFCT